MQIPHKAMKPIPAEILKSVPVISRDKIPPTIANGTFRNTNPASLRFPNMLNNKRNISNRLTGTTCANRF